MNWFNDTWPGRNQKFWLGAKIGFQEKIPFLSEGHYSQNDIVVFVIIKKAI